MHNFSSSLDCARAGAANTIVKINGSALRPSFFIVAAFSNKSAEPNSTSVKLQGAYHGYPIQVNRQTFHRLRPRKAVMLGLDKLAKIAPAKAMRQVIRRNLAENCLFSTGCSCHLPRFTSNLGKLLY